MTADSRIAFYDRSEEERTRITEDAIAEGRTVLERWSALGETEAGPWNGRAALAARYLSAETGVADMGCGVMGLKAHLREEQAYFPVDVVARDERTVVCDFNRQPPPQLPASAAACLGLIEYLLRPDDFLAALGQHYASLTMSYCVTDAPSALPNRRAHAWVNDFDTPTLERMIARTGWTIADRCDVDGMQRLWWLTRR